MNQNVTVIKKKIKKEKLKKKIKKKIKKIFFLKVKKIEKN